MKALILDMDGVIVDSEHQWKILEMPFLRGLLGRWGDADHERIVGLNVVDLYHFLVREYGLREKQEPFLHQCAAQAVEIYTNRVSLAPGLLELLGELDGKNIPVGIASSSPRSWIGIVLTRFSLTERFKAVVSSDDVDGRAKPFPDVYKRAAELLGVPAPDCVAVEDSSVGVRSARAAGMTVVGFRSGFNDEQDLSLAHGLITGFSGRAPLQAIHSRLS